MGDYQLVSPDGSILADIRYVGEPPHGDSYHDLSINGNRFPGYVWGCLFAFSTDSKYLVCSWMDKPIERKTVVIDCTNRKYLVLPQYIYEFSVGWPKVVGVNGKWEGLEYEFTGNEAWSNY
jgi:hypothetical protein